MGKSFKNYTPKYEKTSESRTEGKQSRKPSKGAIKREMLSMALVMRHSSKLLEEFDND